MKQQPDHSQILLAIGNLQGEMVGLKAAVMKNGEAAHKIGEDVSAMQGRVNRLEIWRAEVRGVSIGIKVAWGGAISIVSAAIGVGVSYGLRKLGV